MNVFKKIVAFGITVLVTSAVIWAVFRFVPGLNALDIKHAMIAGAGVSVVNMGTYWVAKTIAGVKDSAGEHPVEPPAAPSNGTAADTSAAPKVTG